MSFQVIDNPNFAYKAKNAGFSNSQFKQLDALFLQAAALKTLTHRSVQCDFDDGVFEYSYHKTKNHAYTYIFIIRRIGPGANMYELWSQNRGKLTQSGMFDRVYNRLMKEISSLTPLKH